MRCVPQDNEQVCLLVLAMSSGQSKTTIGMVHVIIKSDLWMLNNYFQLPWLNEGTSWWCRPISNNISFYHIELSTYRIVRCETICLDEWDYYNNNIPEFQMMNKLQTRISVSVSLFQNLQHLVCLFTVIILFIVSLENFYYHYQWGHTSL